MNYALKFPGRTRQKSTTFLFFTIIFLILAFPLSGPLGVNVTGSPSSVTSPEIVGSGSSEEENIDSFDIHPINRWTANNEGVTAAVSEGLFNLTDTGDATQDSYSLIRGLRDLDGGIEIRFQFSTTISSSSWRDAMLFYLRGDSDTYLLIGIEDIKNDAASEAYIRYRDINGDLQNIIMTGDEKLWEEIWYTYKIDYDILKSEFRVRCYFDNGSKVYDYSFSDFSVSDSKRPALFTATSLELFYLDTFYQNGAVRKDYVDYIKAPFKEREWTTISESSDPQWIEKNWNLAYAEDEVTSEVCRYSLVVPYLDVFSGTLLAQSVDDDNFASIHGGLYSVYLYGVDADDGDKHEIVGVTNGIYDQGSGDGTFQSIETGANFGTSEYLYTTAYDGTQQPKIDFTFGIYNDRSDVSLKIRCFPDAAIDTVYQDYVWSDSISYSQEFIIETYYWINIDAGEDITLSITGASVIERDIFSDIADWVGGVVEDVTGGGTDIFTAIFRWIVSVITDFLAFMLDILTGALSLINQAIVAMQGVLEAAINAIKGVLDNIKTVIDTISTNIGTLLTELQGLAAAVATALWDGVEVALAFIFDAIDEIWDALILILDDIIAQLILLAEDVADFVFALIEFLVVLLLTIVEELWTILEGIAFFIWDAVGLPDLLVLSNELLAYLIELIDWLLITFLDVVDFFNDLSWLILVMWWAWAIPIQWARADFNPLGGIANFIEVYFYDALPWSIIGVHIYIPQGLIFTLWLLLLLPGDFALFTAMAG